MFCANNLFYYLITGPLCAVCADNYHYSTATQSCEECSGTSAINIGSIFSCIAFIIIGVLAIRYSDKNTRKKDLATLLSRVRFFDHHSSEKAVNKVSIDFQLFTKRLLARSKVYTTLYQILLSLPFVLDLNFPVAYTSITSIFSILNWNLMFDFGNNCMYETLNYIDTLVITTTLPIIVACFLYLARFIHIKYYMSKSSNTIDKTSITNHLVSIRNTYFFIFLLFTYLILPNITVTIFRTFSCDNIDPDNVDNGDNYYMRADYSVSCTSSQYYFGFIWASCCIIIYPIGVPLLYYYLLNSSKTQIINRYQSKDISQDNNTLSILYAKFLYDGYKPR